MQFAHHATYAVWLEEARTELLRSRGFTYAAMEAGGLFLVVVKLETRFRRPIRYDDLIDIRATHIPAGHVKIRHDYELRLVERMGRPLDTPERLAEAAAADRSIPPDGVCAIGTTELACVDREGRPTALPEWLRA